jgi:very-short-patch-repair endonuclease
MLRKNATDSERRLWRSLRLLKHSGLHFRRQAPIGPYFADFACHRAKLVIELDGGHHASAAQIIHDRQRTKFLQSIGYEVIRFWNFETFLNEQEIASYVYSLAISPTRRGRASLATSTSPQGVSETEYP